MNSLHGTETLKSSAQEAKEQLYLSRVVQRKDVEVPLDGVHAVQLNVEEEEDKAVEGGAKAVAQPSDACYHPLHHTCGSECQSAADERSKIRH